MTLTQFTKTHNTKKRKIYYITSIIMLSALALMCIKAICGFFGFEWNQYTMMLFEFIHLEAFAVAWIIKSSLK